MSELNAEQILHDLHFFHKRILGTKLGWNIYEREVVAVANAQRFIKELIEINEKLKKNTAEVKHGEWKYNRGQWYGEAPYFCSLCIDGNSYHGMDNYCPNCGAKMDGERKEK